jgi:hypothetical protein
MPLTAPPAQIVASSGATPAAAAGTSGAGTDAGAGVAVGAGSAAGAAGGAGAADSSVRPAATIEGPTEAKVGQEFEVTIHLSTQQAITRLRSQVRFDPTALQLIGSTAGALVPATAGSPTVEARAGGAQLEVISTPEDPVQGDGGLMVLRFKALGPRPATTIGAMLSVIGASGAAVGNSQAPPLNIAIQP